MFDLDPLGSAGRARREEDVGELARIDCGDRGRLVACRRIERRSQHRSGVSRRWILIGDEPPRASCRQHLGATPGRLIGAHRHVGCACCEDPEQHRRQLGRWGQRDTDPIFRADTDCAQMSCPGLGSRPQLGVTPAAFIPDERSRLRDAPRGLGDHLVDAAVIGGKRRLRAELAGDALGITGGQHVVIEQLPIRIGDHLVDEPDELGDPALDRAAIEEIGIVRPLDPDVFAELVDHEREVELGAVELGRWNVTEERQLGAGEADLVHQLGLVVLQSVHHREEPAARRIEARRQLLDRQDARVGVVVVGLQRGGACVFEQLREAHAGADGAAHG